MEFSFFSHFYSNQAQRCEVASWDEFVRSMRALSEAPGYKPPAGDYESEGSALLSPAIYSEDTVQRKNENVMGWDMVMLDIDQGFERLEDVINHFSYHENIIYSSPNCTNEKLKLRIVIPLNKRAPKERLKDVWYAYEQWCHEYVDASTKDASRIYYVPAQYSNQGDRYRHFFLENKGAFLDWEAMCAKYPRPPEAERFKKNNPLRDLKRKIFTSNNDTPTMIITDPNCPFVYPKMIEDYRLTPMGGHHRAIYLFMVKICYNAEKIGYPISIEEVADMGKQVDDIDGGWYDMKKMLGSAADAMEFVGL